jgi:septal ring factor EnvC (AmiA/AmiB activator)
MREFLKGLDLDGELIDTIMAEHGKLVTKDKEELQTLKSQMKELKENSKNADELQSKYEELVKANEEREAREKAEEEDKILTNNINEVFGDKQFTSEYARVGLTNDIKNELNKPENKGRSIKDIFDTLTKDKTDIFANPNQVKDMPGMGESEEKPEIKEIPNIW